MYTFAYITRVYIPDGNSTLENLIFSLYEEKGIIHEWRHFLDISSRSFSTSYSSSYRVNEASKQLHTFLSTLL